MHKTVTSFYNSIQEDDFLIIDGEICTLVNKLEVCLVNELSNCNDKEAARLLRAVFRSARLGTTMCKNIDQKLINSDDTKQEETLVDIILTWIFFICIVGSVTITIILFGYFLIMAIFKFCRKEEYDLRQNETKITNGAIPPVEL